MYNFLKPHFFPTFLKYKYILAQFQQKAKLIANKNLGKYNYLYILKGFGKLVKAFFIVKNTPD